MVHAGMLAGGTVEFGSVVRSLIGVIFDNSTDVNFEIWHDRGQCDSGRACAFPSLRDKSSWFGG